MKTSFSRSIGRLCILAAWVAVVPVMLTEAGAAVFYISPSGLDSAGRNGGSGDPWQTVNYALARVGPGNTVTLMDGNYPAMSLSGTYSGTLANPTIIKAQNKWLATVNNSGSHGIYATGSYFTFDGIKVNNAAIDGIKTDVHGVIVKNCWVLSAGEQGISSHSRNNCLYDSNLSEYNGTSTQLDHGFYISGTNNIIRNNVARHNASYGIQVYPEGAPLYNAENRIYNNLVYDHPNNGGIVVYGDTAGSVNLTNFIYGNTIHNATGAAEGGIKLRYGYAHITNNLVIGTGIVNGGGATVREGSNVTGGSHAGWVSSATGRYWLTAASTARGVATTTAAGAVNFFGAAQASVADVGAFQYTAEAAVDTRTLDPSGTSPNYWAIFTPVASTFYVATTGNDTFAGTQAQPWRTIQKAATTLTAGQTAIVAAGSYGETVTSGAAGTAGNYITIKTTAGASSGAFGINHSYVRVEGFTLTGFTGTPAASVNVGSYADYVQVVGCTITSPNGARGIASDYSVEQRPLGMWVEGNYLLNCGDISVSHTGLGVTVTNNLFTSNIGHDAMVTIASNSTNINNRFVNFIDPDGELNDHSDIIQTDHFGNMSEISTNNFFIGNYITNCPGVQPGNFSAGTVATITGWTFRNNIYVSIAGKFDIGLNDVKFYNNLFYKAGYDHPTPINWVNGGPIFGMGHNGRSYNNVFIECGSNTGANGYGWYHFQPGTIGGQGNNNFVCGAAYVAKTAFPSVNPGQDSNGINGGNPFLVNIPSDFHLTAPSFLLNAGATISGFAIDKDGIVRPQSTAWDIGPYEFVVNSPTVTINQTVGQADPTTTSPVNFTVVFSQSVTGFATGDVTLNGTSGATTGTVTGSGATYNVAVTGMTANGTIVPSILAGRAQNSDGYFNSESYSTDNVVNFIAIVPQTAITVTGVLR